MRILKHFKPDRECVLFEGDCLELLKKIPDATVDLTLTSPPYCIGKAYENTTKIADFIQTHKKILPEIVRVTRPGGSICWQVGYHAKNGAITPLDYYVHEIMSQIDDIKLRNRIIWTYGFGYNSQKRFSGRHEVVLWYTKGDDYHFDLDSVRVPQKYPGKTHYKGSKKGQVQHAI
jgi:adenine-specific DNA-methyltransferase